MYELKEASNEVLGLASGNLAGQEWNFLSDIPLEKLNSVASPKEDICGRKKATKELPEYCKVGGVATDSKICSVQLFILLYDHVGES